MCAWKRFTRSDDVLLPGMQLWKGSLESGVACSAAEWRVSMCIAGAITIDRGPSAETAPSSESGPTEGGARGGAGLPLRNVERAQAAEIGAWSLIRCRGEGHCGYVLPARWSRTIASAESASSRPMGPTRSPVLAFTLTWSAGSASNWATRSRISFL